jgi:hypothetical protein
MNLSLSKNKVPPIDSGHKNNLFNPYRHLGEVSI